MAEISKKAKEFIDTEAKNPEDVKIGELGIKEKLANIGATISKKAKEGYEESKEGLSKAAQKTKDVAEEGVSAIKKAAEDYPIAAGAAGGIAAGAGLLKAYRMLKNKFAKKK